MIAATGKLDIQNNTLNIGGTSTRNATGVLNAVGTSTVNFTSGSAQDVMPNSYANLGLSGAGVKTFPTGTSTVNTLLTANSDIIINGTLAFGAAANASIAGNFTDNGTFTAASGAGVATFNGATQNINGSAATIAFHNMTLAGAGAKSVTGTNNLTVNGALVEQSCD